MMHEAPTSRPSVLIVEDEALVRVDAADGLAAHGFDVIEAASAQQALSLLEAGQRPDVLFTDINMGRGLDGIELARLVRSRWPQTVIVIASGRKAPDVAHSLGHFVPKPYQPDGIALAIRRLIHQRAPGHLMMAAL